MANIIDYVRTFEHTFTRQPLNQVDSLVFSWLAYMRIPEELPEACTREGVTLAHMGSQRDVLGLVAPLYDAKSSEELLRAVAASPRFGQVVACLAVDEWSRAAQKQFSATTFLLPAEDALPAGADAGLAEQGSPMGAYVAFRGTDDTIVGWKENLNMAFQQVVPAQLEATSYVQSVASRLDCPLWVGGHSKGGNLAVYAASTCGESVRNRVQRCFAHDAPGFTDEAMHVEGWVDASDLVDRTIPEESIVGLLFSGAGEDAAVVKSTNPGLLQHAPFSWVVEGDSFATARAVSYDTYRTNKRLSAWIKAMQPEERELFVEVLYKLGQSSGEVTFSGLTSTLADGSLDIMLQRLDGLPQSQRTFFVEALEDLAATMLLGPAPSNPQTSAERADAAADKLDDAKARFNDRQSKLDKYLGI